MLVKPERTNPSPAPPPEKTWKFREKAWKFCEKMPEVFLCRAKQKTRSIFEFCFAQHKKREAFLNSVSRNTIYIKKHGSFVKKRGNSAGQFGILIRTKQIPKSPLGICVARLYAGGSGRGKGSRRAPHVTRPVNEPSGLGFAASRAMLPFLRKRRWEFGHVLRSSTRTLALRMRDIPGS